MDSNKPTSYFEKTNIRTNSKILLTIAKGLLLFKILLKPFCLIKHFYAVDVKGLIVNADDKKVNSVSITEKCKICGIKNTTENNLLTLIQHVLANEE